MNENRRKILEMLSMGRINTEEAERLLELTGQPEAAGCVEEASVVKKNPKYLRVVIKPEEGSSNAEKVNIRVPVSLIRAGVKLTSLMPRDAADQVDSALKDKGVKFNVKDFTDEDIDQLVEALSDLEVDIEDGKSKVKVFTE